MSLWCCRCFSWSWCEVFGEREAIVCWSDGGQRSRQTPSWRQCWRHRCTCKFISLFSAVLSADYEHCRLTADGKESNVSSLRSLLAVEERMSLALVDDRKGIWPQSLRQPHGMHRYFPPLLFLHCHPFLVWEGHGRMVLYRIYAEKESRANQGSHGRWLLNQHMCLCVFQLHYY